MTKPPTISHSQIVAWRNCQQKWHYRYGERLVPKRHERPLYLGNWVHSCLEEHYKGNGWKVGHAPYVAQYNKMFDEEKERLDKGSSKSKGPWEPLPEQVRRIMESYLWYNRNERIKVLGVEVEFRLEVRDESGVLYVLVGKIDLIYEDEDGLIWIRDHKIWGEIPDERAFHTMDPQLTIYLHGARGALGVEAAGIEYSYVKSSAPTVPSLRKDGELSEAAITTDYPTLYRFLKANGKDPGQYKGILTPLAASSPFLKRLRLPRAPQVAERVLADADRTAREILDHDGTVRNITRDCSWCVYEALCRAELFGLDTSYMRRAQFEREKRPTPATPA
jgi:hypothetical protein